MAGRGEKEGENDERLNMFFCGTRNIGIAVLAKWSSCYDTHNRAIMTPVTKRGIIVTCQDGLQELFGGKYSKVDGYGLSPDLHGIRIEVVLNRDIR